MFIHQSDHKKNTLTHKHGHKCIRKKNETYIHTNNMTKEVYCII